jgi:hypothetical protein
MVYILQAVRRPNYQTELTSAGRKLAIKVTTQRISGICAVLPSDLADVAKEELSEIACRTGAIFIKSETNDDAGHSAAAHVALMMQRKDPGFKKISRTLAEVKTCSIIDTAEIMIQLAGVLLKYHIDADRMELLKNKLICFTNVYLQTTLTKRMVDDALFTFATQVFKDFAFTDQVIREMIVITKTLISMVSKMTNGPNAEEVKLNYINMIEQLPDLVD